LVAIAEEAETDDTLQQVVVTAEKRPEEANKVPISLSVFDRATMEQRNMYDISDVANATPGVDYVNAGTQNFISIRGVTSNAGYSTTGIYIDDVPIQVRQTELLLWNTEPQVFDLDRVEVLRGPQGTLFGAGAEGGIIRFITPQPSLTQFSGYARAGIETTANGDPSYNTGVAFGGPIIEDELGFRVSAWHRREGGYIFHDSAVPGGYQYNYSNWTDNDVLRAALTLAPTASLRITPSFDYQHIYANDLPTFDPAGSNIPGDPYTHMLQSLNPPYSNVGAGWFVNPALLQQPSSDQFYLPALKVDLKLTTVEVVSSTSYMYRRYNSVQDYTDTIPGIIGLPYPLTAQAASPSLDPNKQDIFTQEVRAQSLDSSRRLQWTLGVFYTQARQSTEQVVVSPYLPTQVEEGYGLTLQEAFGQGLLPGAISYIGIEPNTRDTQSAVFGQATYQIVKYVSLIAGARVAHDSESYSFYQNGPLAGPVAQSQSGEESQHVIDPKFGINVQFDDNNLLYASAAKGDRIGGVNAPLINIGQCAAALAQLGYPNGAPLTYLADSIWSYEVGSKNSAFNGRMQLATSAFYIDWSNISQNVGVPACAGSFTSNMGKATSKGFDFQAAALVRNDFKLGLSLSYTDARDALAVDKGQQINPYTSPWVIVPTAEYDFPLGDAYKAYLRMDDNYHSKNPGPYQIGNPLFVPNPSYNQFNVHLGAIRDRLDVSVYALNAWNSHPLLYDTAYNPGGGSAYTIRPRTIGITSSYRW
jgi:outer membrane receptor protein involved in Fe transport